MTPPVTKIIPGAPINGARPHRQGGEAGAGLELRYSANQIACSLSSPKASRVSQNQTGAEFALASGEPGQVSRTQGCRERHKGRKTHAAAVSEVRRIAPGSCPPRRLQQAPGRDVAVPAAPRRASQGTSGFDLECRRGLIPGSLPIPYAGSDSSGNFAARPSISSQAASSERSCHPALEPGAGREPLPPQASPGSNSQVRA